MIKTARLFFLRSLVIGLLIICSSAGLYAQEAWSLQKCVEYASQNNLQVKQSLLTQQVSGLTLQQSKLNILPDLNGAATQDYSYGRNVDPYTNSYINSNLNSNTFSLNSSLTIFNGLRKVNTIRQSKFDLAASEKSTQQMVNDISLNVASAFLQVVLDKEQVKVAQQQVDISKEQVDKTQKLVNGGALAEGSLFDIQAQLAKDQVSLVNAQNQLTLALLSLQQLLNLDKPIDTDIPLVEVTPDMLNVTADPEKLYESALMTQPKVAGEQLKVSSAQKGLSISRSAYYPTLSVFATLSTNYSSVAQEIGSIDTSFLPAGYVKNTGQTVLFAFGTYNYKDIPFNTQLNNNFGKIVGLQLNVPIFQNWSAHTNVEKSKINLLNEQLNLDIVEQNLKKDVETAYTNAENASKSYNANLEGEESLKKAFDYATTKLDAGLITATDYNTAKNNYEAAESSLLQAKYQFIFDLKVLDFYMGKPLTL